MDKVFRGPDLVPENGAVTGPLSKDGVFYAEGPTGKVWMKDGQMCVGSTEKQWSDGYYPTEIL